MYTLRRIRTCAALIAVVTTGAMTFGVQAHAEGGTTVVLDNYLRRCDFSRVGVAPKVPSPMLGTGFAVIRTAGSKAVAEVHLYDEPEPGAHFDVGLIQMPRPSSSTCGPGDPGTAFSGMDIDAAGTGTTTVQDTIRPGTTGVWVIIERANANSQNPAEFYTSEFVAPV
ncbi:hypothetical protein BRW65_12300 [Mycobacterium paraffinicum]|uniref:Secreted protein n=1 Tax=Mycobacterium paraffinicum TaxID=53378 RepID=A0A1Q4HVJ7_9MYCO|nr:hypothetical protein [Mycobacterium paraffinicum]OJZ73742.1 hypothetical protein BRW65_12300 [Mycobacterium paraffinicum]